MSQRSIRFPEDVERAVEAEAESLDRSFSWVVINAVRSELKRGQRGGASVPKWVGDEMAKAAADSPIEPAQAVVRPGTPYARKLPAGVKTAREIASERQAALNKAKGS